MKTKYAVENQYGIGLKYEDEHPRDDGYVYVPRAMGEAGYDKCNQWCRRYDSANTCSIVIVDED
jgi:hypothetical protein